MKRIKALTKRNFLETVRDPLSAVFCLGFPIIMLVVMSLILGSIGEGTPTNFQIENYASGIAVFGYTFTMLFVAMNISSDKSGAFIMRLKMSPLKPSEYLISAVISALPVIFVQTVLFFLIAFLLGLPVSVNVLVAIAYLIPSAFLYISIGLLIGALCPSEKNAGPVCSIFISATGILGGVFMPVEQTKGFFRTVCDVLPFYNSVMPSQYAVVGDYSKIFPAVLIVLAYTVVIFVLSSLIIKKSVKS